MKRFFIIVFCLVALLWGGSAPVYAQQKRKATPQARSKARTTRPRKATTTRKATTRKASAPATQGQSSGNLQRDITRLKSQSTTLKKDIDKSEFLLKSLRKDVRSQLSNLSVISGQVENQRKVVDDISGQVDRLAGEVHHLNTQLDTLRRELDDRVQKYRRSMVYLYRNRSRQNKLMFIFSGHNFNQMLRRWQYVRNYASYQRIQGEMVERKQRQVAQKQSEVNAARREQETLLARGRSEQQRLEQQQQERQTVVSNLQKRQRDVQSTLAQNKRRYASLNAQIDRLIQQQIAQEQARREAERRKREAEERRRKEAEARRLEAERKARVAAAKKAGRPVEKKDQTPIKAPRETKRSESATGGGFVLSEREVALSKNFDANRGRLPMPITGPYMITSHYGQYNVAGLSGVKLDSKGINITGKAGAAARAVFEGEVTAVFSLGNLRNVLVRHGSYISVYCNLSSVSVSRGQRVSTRQSLGSVARDASGNCTLHFQLRKERTPLNPEAWLAR